MWHCNSNIMTVNLLNATIYRSLNSQHLFFNCYSVLLKHPRSFLLKTKTSPHGSFQTMLTCCRLQHLYLLKSFPTANSDFPETQEQRRGKRERGVWPKRSEGVRCIYGGDDACVVMLRWRATLRLRWQCHICYALLWTKDKMFKIYVETFSPRDSMCNSLKWPIKLWDRARLFRHLLVLNQGVT